MYQKRKKSIMLIIVLILNTLILIIGKTTSTAKELEWNNLLSEYSYSNMENSLNEANYSEDYKKYLQLTDEEKEKIRCNTKKI